MSDVCRPVVYLHVGAPKTGTTYLQEVLWCNRDVLRQEGVLYPGQDRSSHFHGVQDLLGFSFNGHKDPQVLGAWHRLLDEVGSWPGTVLISHELFALASAEDVDRTMQALSFAEVHVIYTLRDLARQIPSVWQEDLKNRHALSFAEYVRGLRGDQPHHLCDLFWRLQDPVSVLQRWSAQIPPERVHVITIPQRDAAPGLLWKRFADTVGLDADRCETEVDDAANRSLGVVEANLLRRINPMLAAELDWPTYQRWVKRFLTKSALPSSGGLIPITLPISEYKWVHKRSMQFVADLRDAGYDLVGDLQEVVPVPPTCEGSYRHPDDASDAEQLDAATGAIARLTRQLGKIPPARLTPPPAPAEPMTLFRLAVKQLSNRHPSVLRLRQAYRLGKLGLAWLRRRFS